MTTCFSDTFPSRRLLRYLIRPLLLMLGLTISSTLSVFTMAEETRTPTPQIEQQHTFNTQNYSFTYNGIKLAGLLDRPLKIKARGLIIMVPGSGGTNISGNLWNRELRNLFVMHGFNIFAYDKPGQGKSEGTFNSEQTVADSAQEVVSAIAALRRDGLIPNDTIGLWGISRAGWIIPLAIEKEKTIDFWISVSGPTHLDNFAYLLEENWKIAGFSEKKAQTLRNEFLTGFEIQRTGGTYDDYLKATPNLAKDALIKRLRGEYTSERFSSYQSFLLENPPTIDAETGLFVHVDNYPELLKSLKIPTLAQFGEEDSQLDWRETKKLYERTLNESGQLTVVTFQKCNHGIQRCENCAFDENMDTVRDIGFGPACDGFYQSTSDWLNAQGFPLIKGQ